MRRQMPWIRRIATHRFVDQMRKQEGRRRAGEGQTAGWRRNVALEDAHLPTANSLDESLRADLRQSF